MKIPTSYLRFVERTISIPRQMSGEILIGGGVVGKTIRVLQQFVLDPDNQNTVTIDNQDVHGTWEDIPLETE